MKEVKFTFCEATEQEVQEKLADMKRAEKLKHQYAQSLLKVHAAQGMDASGLGEDRNMQVQDYDDLENDTDAEEIASILCQGYLTRSHFCRSTKRRRVCLYTSGRLQIEGNTSFDSLVANISDNSSTFQVASGTTNNKHKKGKGAASDEETGIASSCPSTWWVRNSRTFTWETLEAENPRDAETWDEGFTDVLKFFTPESRKDPSPLKTVFRGFFWVLLDNDADTSRMTSMQGDQWRRRLFCLREDGYLLCYSGANQEDMIVTDIMVDYFAVLHRETMIDDTFVFQVPSEGDWTTLAATREDYFVFENRVISVCNNPKRRTKATQPRIGMKFSVLPVGSEEI